MMWNDKTLLTVLVHHPETHKPGLPDESDDRLCFMHHISSNVSYRMEPVALTCFDHLDSFLARQTHTDSLPVIGTSALDQILSSSPSPSSYSSTSSVDSMESRMSPDSSTSFYNHEYAQADSTTSPGGAKSSNDYDSDAFNSDDSCSSLAEAESVQRFAQRLAQANQGAPAVPSQQNLDLIFNHPKVQYRLLTIS